MIYKSHNNTRYTLATMFILMLSCNTKPKEELLANYLVTNRLTTNLDSSEIDQVTHVLLDSLEWENKIQINLQYNPTRLNIYIINGAIPSIRSDSRLGSILSNCFYAGYNIIFLDISYLRSFLEIHKVVDFESVELKSHKECFLYWVIGHELGHFIFSHPSGHFEAKSLDRLVSNSSLDNKIELQADSFFITRIIKDKNLYISVEELMISILNAEIETKVGKVRTLGTGLIYNYIDTSFVKYAKQRTHPEFVVRLARMLELSSEMSNDNGLHNLVAGFIQQLREVK